MPTNYIIEYYVEDAAKVGMMCQQMGGRAAASPNCPPGVLRYYFAVGPDLIDRASRQKHAVAFFNFMLAASFPRLRDKYALDTIELADDEHSQTTFTNPTAFTEDEATPMLVPAVLQSSTARPRLRRVASLVDCQIGGIIVETDNPASGH
jgi:hypothetical protein